MNKTVFLLMLFSLFTRNLFADDIKKLKVDVLAKTSLSWDGNNLPQYEKGIPEITILKITIPPKTKLDLHMHPVINAGVLLKGTLTVITEKNDKLHLKAQNAIVEVVNKWHYGINEGKEPAQIIVFYAGIKDKPITIEPSLTYRGNNES